MRSNTERDYYRRIARVIEVILLDPGAAHTVDSLASVAHLSPFHFHRIYRALTGESIAGTVQRLRLAQAAHRLTGTGDSVISIALEAGYESPQAFARAFRGLTGVSPSAFQARQRHLTGPRTPLIEPMQVPATNALCLRHEGPIAAIGQTFRKLLRMLCSDGAPAIPPRMIGICTGDPEESDGFCYHAGLVPETPTEPMAGIESLRIEGGLYAAHRLVGPYGLIAPTFRALFGGWLPGSGYVPDDRPALEFYHTPPSPGAQKDCVTDLLIPIRKA
jgi:AraC family transcriptional regulator